MTGRRPPTGKDTMSEMYWVTVREVREYMELVDAESCREAKEKMQEYYINDGVDMEHADVVKVSYHVDKV